MASYELGVATTKVDSSSIGKENTLGEDKLNLDVVVSGEDIGASKKVVGWYVEGIDASTNVEFLGVDDMPVATGVAYAFRVNTTGTYAIQITINARQTLRNAGTELFADLEKVNSDGDDSERLFSHKDITEHYGDRALVTLPRYLTVTEANEKYIVTVEANDDGDYALEEDGSGLDITIVGIATIDTLELENTERKREDAAIRSEFAAADTALGSRIGGNEEKLKGIDDGATDDQTPVEIRDGLVTLQDDNRLDASAIKNIPATGATEPQASEIAANTNRLHGVDNNTGEVNKRINAAQEDSNTAQNIADAAHTLANTADGKADTNASAIRDKTFSFVELTDTVETLGAAGQVVAVNAENKLGFVPAQSGPQGQKGEVGSQGPQGQPGMKGNVGVPGGQGIQGVPGEQGATGTQGDAGPAGARGADGARGEKGDAGQNGSDGQPGDAGRDGVDGQDGASSIKVFITSSDTPVNPTATGYDKSTGLLTGLTSNWSQTYPETITSPAVRWSSEGSVSPNGVTITFGTPYKLRGEQGIRGLPGPEGTATAVDAIAARNRWRGSITGYTDADKPVESIQSQNVGIAVGDIIASSGKKTITVEAIFASQSEVDAGTDVKKSVSPVTLNQRLANNPGPAGPKGDRGEQGLQGDTGIGGIPGTPGDKGDTGGIGPQGIQGSPGEKGDDGARGLDGTSGVKGDPGDAGQPGPMGTSGSQGLMGERGLTGPAGADGDDGINPRGAWVGDGGTYEVNDVVEYLGSAYRCKFSHASAANENPTVGTVRWEIFVSKGEDGQPGEMGDKGDQGGVGTSIDYAYFEQTAQAGPSLPAIPADFTWDGDNLTPVNPATSWRLNPEGYSVGGVSIPAVNSQNSLWVSVITIPGDGSAPMFDVPHRSTGQTGATGAKGEQGIQGPQGQPGGQGVPGSAGQDGADGATGPIGPKGDTGEKGVSGISAGEVGSDLSYIRIPITNNTPLFRGTDITEFTDVPIPQSTPLQSSGNQDNFTVDAGANTFTLQPGTYKANIVWNIDSAQTGNGSGERRFSFARIVDDSDNILAGSAAGYIRHGAESIPPTVLDFNVSVETTVKVIQSSAQMVGFNNGLPHVSSTEDSYIEFVKLEGIKGDIGADSTVPGPKGDAGDRGATGPAGADSTVPGPRGEQGMQGMPGATGDAGPQGEQGDRGPQGLRGEQGEQGEQGGKGDVGDAGPAGADGGAGADGAMGPQGTPGSAGTPGTPGQDGATGPIGPKGEDGAATFKIYNTATGNISPGGIGTLTYTNETISGLANGWSLTYPTSLTSGHERWAADVIVASIRTNISIYGPYQIRGDVGAKGDAGDAGAKGDQGQKGQMGDVGAASTVPGPQGIKGDQGDRGLQGATGTTGPKGDTGDTGSTGLKGATGAAGSDASVSAGDGIDVNNGVVSIEESTTTNRGGVELATTTETQSGTDTTRAVTPSGLLNSIRNGGSYQGNTGRSGSVRLATTTEGRDGTTQGRASTPASTKAYVDGKLASDAETDAGTDNSRIITAQKLQRKIDAIPTDTITVDSSFNIDTVRNVIGEAKLTYYLYLGGSATNNGTFPPGYNRDQYTLEEYQQSFGGSHFYIRQRIVNNSNNLTYRRFQDHTSSWSSWDMEVTETVLQSEIDSAISADTSQTTTQVTIFDKVGDISSSDFTPEFLNFKQGNSGARWQWSDFDRILFIGRRSNNNIQNALVTPAECSNDDIVRLGLAAGQDDVASLAVIESPSSFRRGTTIYSHFRIYGIHDAGTAS